MSAPWAMVVIAALGAIVSICTIVFYAGRLAGRLDANQAQITLWHASNLERFSKIEARLSAIENALVKSRR